MTKYIIGTMSNMDQPMTPVTKGERSMNLYMNKVSEDMLREERNQILDATQDDIRSLYRVAEAVLKAAQKEQDQLLKDVSNELALSSKNDEIADTEKELSKLNEELEELKEESTGATIDK